jgi:hypothetical protein
LFLPAEVLPSDGLDGGEMVDGLANPGGCEYDVDKGQQSAKNIFIYYIYVVHFFTI